MVIAQLTSSVNDWFFKTAGGEDRPAFFDIDATAPALRRVDAAYQEIREEARAVLKLRDQVPTYHEVDAAQTCISATTPNNWRVFYLDLIGEKPAANRALCPVTSRVVDQVPGLFHASFSLLDPGKSVPAHRGAYGGYLRYHLGLIVPTDNPPRLRVRDQYHTWREGGSILFDDSLEHEVYNDSSEPRVVLIVDIRRPMPLAHTAVNRALTRVARRLYAKPTVQRAQRHVPG